MTRTVGSARRRSRRSTSSRSGSCSGHRPLGQPLAGLGTRHTAPTCATLTAMPTVPDPYRTLGLGRDATTEEIRRAYRRLAKANHPDSAGEAALPRFLAIQ